MTNKGTRSVMIDEAVNQCLNDHGMWMAQDEDREKTKTETIPF